MDSSSRRDPEGPPRISLQARDIEVLESWARSAESRASIRARVILLSASGHTASQVAAELGIGVPTVYKWCKRFRNAGLPGLVDLPRSGQPRRLSEERRAEIVRVTNEEPPLRGRRWTIRTLARTLGVTQHQVRQIWAEAGLRPHESDDRVVLKAVSASSGTASALLAPPQ